MILPTTYRYTSVVHVLCKIKYEGSFYAQKRKNLSIQRPLFNYWFVFLDFLCFDSHWLVWLHSETSDFDRVFLGFDLVH